MSYNINDLTIFLKSNNIKIITKSQRMFQAELNYINFIICNDNEDLYSLLNDYLKNNKVSFEIYESKIILTMKIDLPSVKSKNISIEIPELHNEIDIKDMQISMMINNFNKKIEFLENKILSLENNLTKNDYINIPFFVGTIPIETEYLVIVIINYEINKNNLNSDHIYNSIENAKYYIKIYNSTKKKIIHTEKYNDFKYYDLENLKYLIHLKKLVIYDYSIQDKNYILYNIENIKYLQKLEELFIIGLNVDDIHFIKELKNLNTLYINSNLILSNIEPLKYCDKLTELNITGCPKIINLNHLTNPQLKITK